MVNPYRAAQKVRYETSRLQQAKAIPVICTYCGKPVVPVGDDWNRDFRNPMHRLCANTKAMVTPKVDRVDATEEELKVPLRKYQMRYWWNVILEAKPIPVETWMRWKAAVYRTIAHEDCPIGTSKKQNRVLRGKAVILLGAIEMAEHGWYFPRATSFDPPRTPAGRNYPGAHAGRRDGGGAVHAEGQGDAGSRRDQGPADRPAGVPERLPDGTGTPGGG